MFQASGIGTFHGMYMMSFFLLISNVSLYPIEFYTQRFSSSDFCISKHYDNVC